MTAVTFTSMTALGVNMGASIGALGLPSEPNPPPSSAFVMVSSEAERNIIQKGLDSIQAILRNAATDKQARIQFSKIIRDEDLSQVITRDHIPLLLEAAKAAPILLDMAISHLPDLFILSDLASIRPLSVWAAMRLIASRPDWKRESEVYLSETPYEDSISRHENDVRLAKERHRSAIQSAAALLSGPAYVVLDLLEGTA